MEYDYPHKNTAEGERKTPTAAFNLPQLPPRLEELRTDATEREIPVSDPETLAFIITLLSALRPNEILELGTAVGLSAAVMRTVCPSAHITTIEKNPSFYGEAVNNFRRLNMEDGITAVCGDAGEEIYKFDRTFDFIFLDSAKVQYVKYLPRLKQLLNAGGVLLADDVLLFGYVTGETPVPPKRKMLAEHIKEYIKAATEDDGLSTVVINLGNGLAMSVKKP